jgi:predicted Zn-ribbon and HTH transcriptional regulator
MNIILTEIKCQECGIKLSEYEIQEKGSRCMECYEDELKSN